MIIDFDALINDLDDKPIKNMINGKEENMILKNVVENSLLMVKEENPDNKTLLFDTALMIHNGGKIDVPVEKVIIIKNAIKKVYNQLIVGRACHLLDK